MPQGDDCRLDVVGDAEFAAPDRKAAAGIIFRRKNK
jgi:hypothetical protein